ncbi:MAG TPA: XF1762 family protein [Solirubrobacteraceae bacterium]|jgi:hypothetical protein
MPVSLKTANAYIAEQHRHDWLVAGCMSVVGVREGERLCGVAVGRPVARLLDGGYTAEVRRVCTDGTYNACRPGAP